MIEEVVYNDEIEMPKMKKKKKKVNKVFIVSLILIITIILGIIIIAKYYTSLNSITYENYELYQYFSGLKVEYNGKATIKHNDSITNIESEGKKVNVGDIPIYFQNIDNECLLPETMELVFPSIKNKSYKVNYFSKIIYDNTDGEESSFLSYNNKKTFIDKSFLYNGDDLYFFPYSTKVLIDGKSYMLSPLSYIIVNYKGMIEMYDKENDKYTIIDEHNDDAIAYIDEYKIDLSTDMIMYKDENRLLIKNLDKLSNYNK